MNIHPVTIIKNATNVQFMKLKVRAQKGQTTKVRNQLNDTLDKLHELQHSTIMRREAESGKYKGNEYKGYEAQVKAIDEKYNGDADWGVLQTGNVIDLRAAFIINQGIKVVKVDPTKGQDELEWANEFLKYNGLDSEVSQAFAIEAEIEGKIALKLAPDEREAKDKDGKDIKETMISVRFVSWTDKKYVIETAPEDYLKYEKMTWTPSGGELQTLEEKQFVYKKFGGRINKPNKAAPKAGKCLTQIDNLDKALRDWRQIDDIFAAPILNVKCETREQMEDTQTALDNKNWVAKKIFVSTTEMKYAQLDIKGVQSIETEISTLAKIISGTTGIPVHFLGFTDILKQVTTAKNLMESIKAATSKERETWIGAYNEVIEKAMAMHNDKSGNSQLSGGKRLNPDLITVEIPFITEDEWDHLINFYLPAAIANIITKETVQKKVPGLDVEQEKKLQQEEEGKELVETKRDRDQIRKDLNTRLLDEGEED